MNKITRKRLVNAHTSDNTELFITLDGRRTKLADCKVRFELFENKTEIPVLGSRTCSFKTARYAVAQCSDFTFTRSVDEELISNAAAFDMRVEYQRPDGVYETANILNAFPTEIDPEGEWYFELPQIPKFL